MTAPPSPLPKYVYKILDQPPDDPLPSTLPTTPLDQKDGFVHLSSAAQVPETARLYFANHDKLWVLELPLKSLERDDEEGNSNDNKNEKGHGTGEPEKKVRWEGPRGCAHFYGRALRREDVRRVIVVEKGEGEKWEVILADLERIR